MEQVAPQARGRSGGYQVKRQAEGPYSSSDINPAWACWTALEYAVNTRFHGGFHEATRGLSDALQAFKNGFRILADMDDQVSRRRPGFGLGQRAENCLE